MLRFGFILFFGAIVACSERPTSTDGVSEGSLDDVLRYVRADFINKNPSGIEANHVKVIVLQSSLLHNSQFDILIADSPTIPGLQRLYVTKDRMHPVELSGEFAWDFKDVCFFDERFVVFTYVRVQGSRNAGIAVFDLNLYDLQRFHECGIVMEKRVPSNTHFRFNLDQRTVLEVDVTEATSHTIALLDSEMFIGVLR